MFAFGRIPVRDQGDWAFAIGRIPVRVRETEHDQAQEALRTMEAALRQKIGAALEGSDEKRHLQELLALLSGPKTPEAPPTASKAPTPSFASILEEMGVPMIRSSRRLNFRAMERAMKDRCHGSP